MVRNGKIWRPLLLGTALLTLGLTAHSAEKPQPAAPLKVTVTSQEMNPGKPVSELLYGNFVELGYGLQVEPMTSQLLFNRSFEPFTPYNGSNQYWFGLFKDLQHPEKGVETDWTKMIWYHSGYEHNAWFAAPGSEGPFRIAPDSTFLIEKSPVLKVELKPTREKADVRHGTQALRLVNHEPQKWGALAQEGKWLRKGERYTFSGLIKSGGGPLRAEVRLYPKGQWDKPFLTIPIEKIGLEYSRKTVSFNNDSFAGWATFSLWIPPQSSAVVDDFSLLDDSGFYGWRRDAVETVRRLSPKVMRFPGGCFASYYDWREGIGPLEQRQPKPSYAWGGLNYNDVGTAEFAMLCKAAGSEMMFCVNLYHPQKRRFFQTRNERGEKSESPHGFDFPQFTDPAKGARSAADWVAYCNRPAGSHKMADLRARHGFKKPFGVKFWELDNETFRWFTPEEYAHAAVTYARAMKAVDPTIQVGLVTYAWAKPEEAIPAMLKICGQDIDFFADRADAEKELGQKLGLMRAYNAAHGTHIRYCNTEWFPWEGGDFNVYTGINDSSVWSRNCRWFHGLYVMKNFLAWQRAGGDVMFINYNNLANTHGQNVIETPKEGTYLSADGQALAMLAHSPAARPLKLEGYTAQIKDDFQVQAAWDKGRRRLSLYVLNRTGQTRKAEFDLAKLGRTFRAAETRTLRAEDPMARDTLKAPEAIGRQDSRQSGLKVQTAYTVLAHPWSFVEVILK